MTSTETNSSSTGELHPRIAELMGALDASRAELHALVASLPQEALSAPPNDAEWSVAQILEHLSMVEDGAGRLCSKIVREVEASGARETETSSVLGLNDALGISAADVRITAPERVRPTAGLTPEESMSRLEASRRKLKEVLQRASGLPLGAASVPHPIFGPFNGYQWVLTLAQHERRHIRQLRRAAGLGDA